MSCLKQIFSKATKKFAPPPKLTISEWANLYRFLSPEASAEPGRYNTDRAPFQKGIMDAITEVLVRTVVFMASSQVGKTEIINNAVGYYIDIDPCPILLTQPTLEMAESYSKDRLAPMLRDTPVLREKVGGERSKDGSSTILFKKFEGGGIHLSGANSPASLASRPKRIIIMDEIDRYNKSAGEEGDPVKLAEKRSTTFFNRKSIKVSTPTIKGDSRIEADFEMSDKRYYNVKCPHCQAKQRFKFGQLKWKEDQPETATYYCESCGEEIQEKYKMKMLREGEWIATAPFKGIAGFHINELYSPWKRWAEIAADFLEAKRIGPEALKVFVNTSLGETWTRKEGDVPKWQDIYNKRESYQIGIVPKDVVFLTAGADIQKDRIEVEIVGWMEDKITYSVNYLVFTGDTSKITGPGSPWEELKKLLYSSIETENGGALYISVMAVDSGYNTQSVYSWVRKQDQRRVIAIKGYEEQSMPLGVPKPVDLDSRGKRKKRGITLWPVGTSIIKSEIYAWLRLEKPTDEELKENGGKYPYGYCHFPEYNEEFFKMLTAEEMVSKTIRGYRKYFWEKTRERNESLDARVYARAAASKFGIDRFKKEDWERLRSEQLPPVEPGEPISNQTKNTVKKEKKKKNSYLG